MIGRVFGGKYILERQIASGGMGLIWVAFDKILRRSVAIKLMSGDRGTSADSHARFEQEATTIAQLRNPHVIQVYDFGVDEGCPYIVMELLEGEDLDVRLRRQGTLPIADVGAIVAQAARALGAAHAAGIVHRDLKPANLFLVTTDAEESVKILDFGVAALLDGSRPLDARGPVLVGTPPYMSPEQVRGSPVDHRSDLWSLGVVLYRALTGRLPFPSESLGDLLVDICTFSPSLPSNVAPHLGQAVNAFFERALAKDPARRFQSAREMAVEFAAVIEEVDHKKPVKILVVDDEPDMAALVRQRFRRQIRDSVYEFAFAADGAAALEQIRRDPEIDVALTDINMPGMSGLTFLSHVGEANPMLRVIMVSAYSDMSNIRTAMNRGAVDFVVKPIDFTDLEAVIQKQAKQAREVRRSVRSTEENSLLRTFVKGGLVDRLLPIVQTSDVLASEAIHGTVAFIDVHGFLRRTRAERPESAVRLLNAHFEVIVPQVTSRGGRVDKFVGDAVMAVFHGKDHAERAVDCCVAIRVELRRMAERAGERSPYAQGVTLGVASGVLIAGSVGSRALGRLDATVLGPVVATAAYLSRRADKDQILIDPSTYELVRRGFSCEASGRAPLPAEDEPIDVYSVIEQLSAAKRLESADAPTLLADNRR